MIKKILLFFLLCLICGCLAPEALEEQYFLVEKVEYKDSGILLFDGRYDKSQWGISEIRGKVSGDAIELQGMAEFWGGESRIAHQLSVPAKINHVRFGSKVIWSRQETPPDKTTAAEDFPSVQEKVPQTASPAPAEVASPVVRVLKIGGNAACLKVRFADFISMFWGENISPSETADAGVKLHGSDGELYEAGSSFINQFQDLEILEIKGTQKVRQVDISGLSLPKLKKLLLDNVEVSGLETVKLPALEEFYLNDFRYVPLSKVSLPKELPALHTLAVQAFAGNFDFTSLSGKPLKRVWINGDCRNFEFLRGLPLEELKLTGFRSLPGQLSVLKSLPLKKLRLSPLRMADWSFLAGMKLQLLDIKCSGESNFSPVLLKGMPLEILRLTVGRRDYRDEWMSCRDLPLKEFVMQGGAVPEKFLLEVKPERIGLFHCYWHVANPVPLFRMMPGLKHLAVWRIFRLHSAAPSVRVDHRLRWQQLAGSNVESLAVSAGDIGFVRYLPRLKRLAVRESGKQLHSLNVLSGRSFEILRLPTDKWRKYDVQVKHSELQDISAMEW